MKRALAGALVALALLTSACKGDSPRPGANATSTTRPPSAGVVRVGVWLPPDPANGTYGGAIVRSLIYPQLFLATPKGAFEPSLVAKGSDKTGPGATSATLRLRAGAQWSDGSAITVEDLKRSVDTRFVRSIDGPAADGTITLQFTQKLPTWRRLWSGLEVITPATAGVYGGPFVVAGTTPNLETVLHPNPTFFGEKPKITELRLVLVPDPEIAARLMARGELDVIAPPAFSARTDRLRAIKGATVLTDNTPGSGWTVALIANPAKLAPDARAAILSLADAKRFAGVLLRGEAEADRAPAPGAPSTPPTTTFRPSLSAPNESPPAGLLLHAMQRKGRDGGVGFDLRQANFDDILGAYASSDFDVLYRLQPPSAATCWVCEAGSVDPALAAAADAGDARAATALTARLRNEGLVRPLWRERSVAAVRNGLAGVSVNGFSAAGPLWNAANWHWMG